MRNELLTVTGQTGRIVPVRSAARGFTLIEMLIVLAIIGVTVAMIRLSSGVLDRVSASKDGNDLPGVALQRLTWSLAAASEQAQVRGRPIALDAVTGVYRFYALDPAGRWVPIEGDPVFAERAVPRNWAWEEIQRDGDRISAPYRLIFGTEPVRFSIQIASGDQRFVVVGNSLGAVDWRKK